MFVHHACMLCMFDSMYEAEGIGLAANQIGLNLHLFIIDVTHTDEANETHVFINSEILSYHGKNTLFQEDLLSLKHQILLLLG